MDESLLDAADLNYQQSQGVFLATSGAGEIAETRELLLASCGFPMQEFNQAFVKRPPTEPDTLINRGEAWFGERGLPFLWTVRGDLAETVAKPLLARGYSERASTPAMILDPIGPGSRAAPAELEIRRVDTPEELEQFQTVAETGFGLPRGAGRLTVSSRVHRRPDVELYLGRVEGRAVVTSALLVTGHVAGIYWVACLEEFRRRGLGEALTWAAVRAGAERGCRFASLQASELGRPVYARMGFTEPTRYVHYGSRKIPPR